MFTPIEAEARDGKRLDFGKLREVQRLYDELRKPAFTSERKEYSRLALALAARIAGTQLDSSTLSKEGQTTTAGETASKSSSDTSSRATSSSSTTAGTADPTMTSKEESSTNETSTETLKSDDGSTLTKETNRSRTTRLKTPDIPTVPSFPTVPTEVMTELLDLLKSASPGSTLNLPPDEMASLIAANQAFMTNLEEFYNVSGYDFVRGLSSDYVPYRMHFTVTVEPGWYSRWYDYDGVAEVELDCPDATPGHAPSLVILGVAPAETGQTVTDYVAALDQLGAALDVAGSQGTVAVAAKAEYVRAVAERLQGMRSERTLTVAFPGTSKMRIRFQAARIADRERRRDLQPVSRLLTAIVLVRREFMESPSLSGGGGAVRTLAATPRAPGKQIIDATEDLEETEEKLRSALRRSVTATLPVFKPKIDDTTTIPWGIDLKGLDAFTGLNKPEKTVVTVDEAEAPVEFTVQRAKIENALTTGKLGEVKAGATELAASIENTRRLDMMMVASPWGPLKVPVSTSSPARLALAAELRQLASEYEIRTIHLQALRSGHLRGAIQLSGRPCMARVDSYFSASACDETGQWAAVRETPFGSNRPHERLRADCTALSTWIPPWLGEVRTRLTIERARGYYRLPIWQLDKKAAEHLDAANTLEDARSHLKDAETKTALAATAAEDQEVALKTARASEIDLQAKYEGAEDAAGKAALKVRLGAATAERQEVEVALAEAVKRLVAAEGAVEKSRVNVAAKQSALRRASAELLHARADVLREGRVVVHFSVHGPSTVVCEGGARADAQAAVRIVGLDDCRSGPACTKDLVISLHEIEGGLYEGVLDLAGVDLSFALAATPDSNDDLRRLGPVRIVLQAAVLKDPCPDCNGKATEQAGFEQTAVSEVELLPWSMSSGSPR